MFKFVTAGVLLAGMCLPALAGQVSLGYIGVYPGPGAASDYQYIVLWNLSGMDPCTPADAASPALSCDQVNLTNWSVDIDYTMLVGGAQIPQPAVHNDSTSCGIAGCDTIVSNNYFLDPPLYAALPYTVTSTCCDTLVTRIVFTASLAGPIQIRNYGDTVSSTFFPQSPFTFTVDIPPGSDYARGIANAFPPLTDLIISDGPGPGPVPAVPEPATLILALGGVLATVARRCCHKDRRKA